MDATCEAAPQQRNSTTRFPNHYKTRFCASFSNCHRGATCGFAHSREEIRAPLLPIEEEQCQPCAMTSEFFINRYKTLWCPFGAQHDWLACPYAHSYQDARRDVSIGYGVKPCPYWNKSKACEDYLQRCPLGVACPFAHGAKEQLYHPSHFKTGICKDFRKKCCPRGTVCAFYHNVCEKRNAAAAHVNYKAPLPHERVPKEWAARFLAPPLFSEDGAIPSNEQCYQYDSRKHDVQQPLGVENQDHVWDKVSMLEPVFISIEELSSFCTGGEPTLTSSQQWLERGLAEHSHLAISTVDDPDILPPPGLGIALSTNGTSSTRSRARVVGEPEFLAPPGLEKGLIPIGSSTTSSTVSEPDDDHCHSEDGEDWLPFDIGARFPGPSKKLFSPEEALRGNELPQFQWAIPAELIVGGH